MAAGKRVRNFGTVKDRQLETSDPLTGKKAKSYLARYTGPDMRKYSKTFNKRGLANIWLSDARDKIESGKWTKPLTKSEEARRAREAEAAAAVRTFGAYAERYLADPDRALRPTTSREYARLLETKLLPTFGDRLLDSITVSDIKAWRASLNSTTPSVNAAAYRLLRSILNAAEADELIDRAPAAIRKASTARPRHDVVPATLDQLVTIVEAMPERLRLLVLLAANVGLREGELLELRRRDVDAVNGTITVTRKIEKDRDPDAPGACPSCGRVIGPPKTAKGRRTVNVSTPFLPLLRAHMLQHTAPGEDGLLFPGDRTDHMSVRFLMDRYRPARKTAGRHDLTIHHLRHTALTLAGQHGATAAELQARAGHASQAAMAIYQHGTQDRDAALAARIGETVAAHSAMAEALTRWTR